MWRLTSIIATGQGYRVTVGDESGEERTYPFTAEEVDVAGTTLLMIRSLEFDGDTLFDRGSAKAIFDAVTAFHRAHVRSVRIGRDGVSPPVSS